ncbi:phenylacetate--CoA ligase family protein [Marinobacter sp. DUT-3]|uniref:phenylacetate--CoA ligase family protein n=1 Tax=Marinobacter sp. DUT-3 TaxID=3412036 RepID=UPI003D18761F
MDINQLFFRCVYNLVLMIRGENISVIVKELEESQYGDLTTIERIQISRLNKLISFAKENVPFYDYLPSTPIKSIDDLAKIPMVEKGDVRNRKDEFLVPGRKGQRSKTSGGSTGAPVTLLKDSEGMAHELAATWRGYGWAGIGVGHRQLRFWGVPRNLHEKLRSKVIDFVCNRHRVTAFGYNDREFYRILKSINKFKPDYVYGYTSIIKEFSDFLIVNNLSVKSDIRSIITTSEVLSPSDRRVIEKAFDSRVFDEYGCGEVGTIAHECEGGSLHINSENVIVEVLDDRGNACSPGFPGEIVVTDLTNFSMPLIRYRIKDWGTISSKECSCGRGLRVLEKIHGRQYDYLVSSSGKKFHGEFFLYIVEDARKIGLNIEGVQFVQRVDGSIMVYLVADESIWDESVNFIRSRIVNGFDRAARVDFQFVKSIDREPSGKIRVVKRELAE